jgi:hypothetical protein
MLRAQKELTGVPCNDLVNQTKRSLSVQIPIFNSLHNGRQINCFGPLRLLSDKRMDCRRK